MARRTLNRRDLRAANDAAERRTDDDELDENGGDEEPEGDGEAGEGKKPKKAKVAKVKAPKAPKVAKPRKPRTPKITRVKVIWGVFNNSNARVAAFDYPRKSEAVALAAKLTHDKKSTHFVQPVKEPMEEKKEEEVAAPSKSK